MYSPHTPAIAPDARDVRQKITKKLASSLRALQIRYVTTDDVITSDVDDANGLCIALEAIFIHGLKAKFIKTQPERRRNKGRHVPLPQPAYWALLKAITHRNVISQLESTSYINTDVGRCRSWLRQALNECLLECYFITLQREKSRLLEYYQPFALMLDAEDCDIVLSYLQGLSALIFSLSYKSSILNEWTASPLILSGLWVDDAERVIQYEPHRRKSLDSVSQSSSSDDTNNSSLVVSDSSRKDETPSLILDTSSSSSQLSSSLGSDEHAQTRESAAPNLSESCVFSSQVTGTTETEELTKPQAENMDVVVSPAFHVVSPSSCPCTPILELQPSIIQCVESAETPPADVLHPEPGDSTTDPNKTISELNSAPDTPASHTALTPEVCPAAELPKSRSWISEEDFHRAEPVVPVEEAPPGNFLSPQTSDLVTVLTEAPSQPAKAFNVVHRRQIGLSNPFRGLLMMGSLERKNALGLFKPYYCELTPYEFRLQVEGDEQSCAENCSLLRCESVGPTQSDGRFELQFPGKRLYLRAPSGEAQDWVDRIQEAIQKIRPQKDDTWEIIHYPDSSQGCVQKKGWTPCEDLTSPDGSPFFQVFDWVYEMKPEPDALKESVLYMKIHKKWTRFIFSLSERALTCFHPRGSEKALYEVYSAELVKDILPDSSLGSSSCFRLVTTKGSLKLQAESPSEAKSWREIVRAAYLESEEESTPLPTAGNFQIKSHIKDHLLFQYLLHIPTERGLDTQNFKCAGCHKQIGFQFGRAKLCAFSGLYYCDLCHQDEVSIIPSRMVHNWDLTERAVSRLALNFLKMVQNEPIINMKCLNERLYQHTQSMYEISHNREKLRLLGEYLMTCRSGALKELSASLDQRNYLLDCAHTYSVRDLKQIADGVFDYFLQSALEFASSHVYRCDLCSQRGFICQICNSDEIIYPFQFDTTTRCSDCKAVFHRPCKMASRPCPRCLRRKKNQDQCVKM